MGINIGKEAKAARAARLISGTKQVLSGVTQVTFGGKSVTVAFILDRLQEVVDNRAKVDVTKAAFDTAVAAEDEQAPALEGFVADYVAFLRSYVDDDAVSLEPFGLAPKRARRTQTVGEKAAAVAKREGTRAARHTMGPIAKLAIKGDVGGVEVTPLVVGPLTPEPTQPAATPQAAARTPAHSGS